MIGPKIFLVVKKIIAKRDICRDDDKDTDMAVEAKVAIYTKETACNDGIDTVE